jgi:hypothetical protein
MAYEPKNGELTVWKNDKYVTGGNQPYAKGTGFDLNGVEIDVALWMPKSDKVKGFNLTIKPAYKKQEVENLTTGTEPDTLPF